MLPRTLTRIAILSCGVFTLAAFSALADEKKEQKDKPALSGIWVQQGGELKIEVVDKENLKIFPHGDNPVIVILCKYSLEKKGVVKAKISDFEGKDEAKEKVKQMLQIGLEFRFTWQIKDGTATLDNVKGEEVAPLKSHLEGKYEQKK